MDQVRQAYADALYRRFHSEDAQQSDRLNRWRSIEPESAKLLSLLLLGKQARRVLEIGTSGGYSTLWLADALETIGQGRLTTVEIDENRHAEARQHVQACGLEDIVEAVCADALDFLQHQAGSYDVVLLDAERPAYPAYWPYLKNCLRDVGSLLVVDNVLSHADQVAEFAALLAADTAFESTTLPVGAGLLLAVRRA